MIASLATAMPTAAGLLRLRASCAAEAQLVTPHQTTRAASVRVSTASGGRLITNASAKKATMSQLCQLLRGKPRRSHRIAFLWWRAHARLELTLTPRLLRAFQTLFARHLTCATAKEAATTAHLLSSVYVRKYKATSLPTAMQLARTSRLKLIKSLQARSASKLVRLHLSATTQAYLVRAST